MKVRVIWSETVTAQSGDRQRVADPFDNSYFCGGFEIVRNGLHFMPTNASFNTYLAPLLDKLIECSLLTQGIPCSLGDLLSRPTIVTPRNSQILLPTSITR